MGAASCLPGVDHPGNTEPIDTHLFGFRHAVLLNDGAQEGPDLIGTEERRGCQFALVGGTDAFPVWGEERSRRDALINVHANGFSQSDIPIELTHIDLQKIEVPFEIIAQLGVIQVRRKRTAVAAPVGAEFHHQKVMSLPGHAQCRIDLVFGSGFDTVDTE
jgi:hypothetical protein